MYTECPNCQTYFKITPEQLKAAEGKVRCGGCSHVFNALTHLVEKVPAQVTQVSNLSSSTTLENTHQKVSASSGDNSPEHSSALSSESINIADTELSVSNPVEGVGVHEPAQGIKKTAANISDINKDIDDALNNLFDDDSSFVKEASLDNTAHTSASPKQKQPPATKDEIKPASAVDPREMKATEFDLSDGFDEFLHDETLDSNSPELEGLSGSDTFMSSDTLKTDGAEWETLSRPASPPSRPMKTGSRLDGVMSFVRVKMNFSRGMWITVICFLLVVLLGQFAYSKHEELVKYPMIRPVLEQSCALLNLVVDCQVPAPKDVSLIVIVDTIVEGHPKADNALLITSSIRSDAEFNQAFPELILTFSDFKKKILARRVFQPEEYLVEGVSISRGMSPRKPVKIMLEIVDPGKDAVNYEFDFR